MPTISWFYGIAIRMYFLDHPPPHFEAIYGEHEANVSIETGEVTDGRLPAMAARLVKRGASRQTMDTCAPGGIEGELGPRAC